MLSSRARVASRRISFPSYIYTGTQLSKACLTQSSRPVRAALARASPRSISNTAQRYYNGKSHPPGGTHRMHLGGEPEKSALEEYGVDLTARARDGMVTTSLWSTVAGILMDSNRETRPCNRKRRRDPTNDSNLIPPDKEQSCAYWSRWDW